MLQTTAILPRGRAGPNGHAVLRLAEEVVSCSVAENWYDLLSTRTGVCDA